MQLTGIDPGDPAAKIAIPSSPPRLNFTGTACPAFAVLTAGAAAMGAANPEKL